MVAKQHPLLAELTLPALWVDVDQGSVFVIDSKEASDGNYLGYKGFQALEVFDSAGRYLLVESISLEGNPGWLKRAWMRVVNARCRVVYDSVKDLGK